MHTIDNNCWHQVSEWVMNFPNCWLRDYRQHIMMWSFLTVFRKCWKVFCTLFLANNFSFCYCFRCMAEVFKSGNPIKSCTKDLKYFSYAIDGNCWRWVSNEKWVFTNCWLRNHRRHIILWSFVTVFKICWKVFNKLCFTYVFFFVLVNLDLSFYVFLLFLFKMHGKKLLSWENTPWPPFN